MQRSLTATDVIFLSLQSAVFCVQCELLSENNTPQCLGCGSGAVLSLSRVFGGSVRAEPPASLIPDAELVWLPGLPVLCHPLHWVVRRQQVSHQLRHSN